ncbi:MAG: alpha/beta hydrolase [Acidobacteria bacterium]|nr:alpha/beta hydrolase [Acidobacteriota bacterium]
MRRNRSNYGWKYFISGVVTVGALVAFIATSGWLAPREAFAQSQPVVMSNVEYARVGSKALLLDLFLPSGGQGPFPLVIWIHGGGWSGGDKALSLNSLQVRQTTRGYAVASLNYRLSGEAIFPAQIEDCKAAIRWLRANAAQYNIDANRIGVWGSSAGGHLVALLGTSGDVADLEGSVGGNLQYSSRVQAVVDWYGPTRLLSIASQALPCSILDHNAANSPESRLIGCTVQSCPEKAERASPTSYVTADDPPFLLMHGTSDCSVPPLQSQELFDRLKNSGVTATLTYWQDAGHGGAAFTSSASQQQIEGFFDQHLKSATPTPQSLKIARAEVGKKKVLVYGEGFANNAMILLNGEAQSTVNDSQNPETLLIAKKAGKKITAGQTVMIQVQNPDGSKSNELMFTRP